MRVPSDLTAIIIAKDEEKRIGKAIESVSFAKQVIVVDNLSTDRTQAIAEQKGARVVRCSSHDFSEVRTMGMKEARSEWIFYLDADEEVTEELKKEILRVINSKGLIHAYRISRRNIFLGRVWPTPDRQVRLFLRKYLKGWKGSVHESAVVDGRIGELSSTMNHFTHRTLSEMVEKTNEWSAIEAQLRFEAHHPAMSWWRMFRVMATTFFDYFIKQKGYRVGMVGLIESVYQSFSTFVTYAKLWEMQRNVMKDE